jgi:hypothetical protein
VLLIGPVPFLQEKEDHTRLIFMLFLGRSLSTKHCFAPYNLCEWGILKVVSPTEVLFRYLTIICNLKVGGRFSVSYSTGPSMLIFHYNSLGASIFAFVNSEVVWSILRS